MARKASSKPDSGPSSTATIGFEADSCGFGLCHSGFVIASAVPGWPFYGAQIPGRLWFLRKSEGVGKCRAGAKFELALAA